MSAASLTLDTFSIRSSMGNGKPEKGMCDHGLVVTFAVYSSSLNGRKSF